MILRVLAAFMPASDQASRGNGQSVGLLGRGLAVTGLAIILGGAIVRPAMALDIQQVQSDGGISAWLVEDHSNPLIAVAIGFDGGSSDDPLGKEGLAELASGLLDEGAGDIDSASFQQQLTDN